MLGKLDKSIDFSSKSFGNWSGKYSFVVFCVSDVEKTSLFHSIENGLYHEVQMLDMLLISLILFSRTSACFTSCSLINVIHDSESHFIVGYFDQSMLFFCIFSRR
jgi:hypothetical protein